MVERQDKDGACVVCVLCGCCTFRLWCVVCGLYALSKLVSVLCLCCVCVWEWCGGVGVPSTFSKIKRDRPRQEAFGIGSGCAKRPKSHLGDTHSFPKLPALISSYNRPVSTPPINQPGNTSNIFALFLSGGGGGEGVCLFAFRRSFFFGEVDYFVKVSFSSC